MRKNVTVVGSGNAGVIARAGFALLGLIFVLTICPNDSYGSDSIPGVIASMTQPVYPLLIRNQYGSLLRVIIMVGKLEESHPFERNDVRLTSISFTLDGADDLGDLQSLELFSTGETEELIPPPRRGGSLRRQQTTPMAVGEPVHPTSAFTFHTNLLLRPGKNVFWLSCKLKESADLSHRVAAACTAVETTAGKLTPHDESPGIRHRIGIALRKEYDDGVDTYAIPSLATTPAGTLLCVYDMRRRAPGHDLQDDIDTGLSRSTNGGKTWEPARVIMDMGEYGGLPQEQNGVSDPGIIVDQQTGEIFVFAVWMNGKRGHHQWIGDGSESGYEIGKTAQFLMVRSRDDGRTWSKPENLTRKLKKESWWLFAPSPQQGIQLADGTLVMPVQGRSARGKAESWGSFSTVMTSRDHGATWTVGTPAYSFASESQAVQLEDGSIMLNMRNETEGESYNYRAVFVTHDLGQTWHPHETNLHTLIDPNCNASLLRVDYVEASKKKHVLLFANPHSKVQRERTNHTIQVSFDDGLTWPQEYHTLLDQGNGWGYPSLSRIDDRHVGIVYAGSQADLVFEKISLDELLHR
jgi:sialidase-1